MNIIIEEIVSEFPVIITEEVVQIEIFDVISYFDLVETYDNNFVDKDGYVPTVDEASGKIVLREPTGGASGNQTLAQTLVFGNTTEGKNIAISNGDSVLLDNGSMLKKGSIDAGNGGSKGISQICGVGFEHKWEAGRLYIMNDGGTTIREVSHNFTYTPAFTDDITKGFVQNTRWILDNGDIYVCADPTEGAAVWEFITGAVPTLNQVTTEGNETTNPIKVIDTGNSSTQLQANGISFEDLDDFGITLLSFQQNLEPSPQIVEVRPLGGTMALLSDITTPTLQQVTDEDNETTNDLIVKDSENKISLRPRSIQFQDLDQEGSTTLRFEDTDVLDQEVFIRGLGGTIALTSDIPDTSTFVPYTGATNIVDLGYNALKAGSLVTQNNGPDKSMTLNSTNIQSNKIAEWQDKDYIGIADITDIPTKTSDLINDGEDGSHPYITLLDLPSNLILYPTTVASDVSGYVKLVTDIHDVDYNVTAVDVSTGSLTTTNQLISSLITVPDLISGNPGVFNISTVGNIRRSAGTGTAEFYFNVYKRDSLGAETLIGVSNPTLPVNNGVYAEFSATAIWDDGVFTATDRIVLKFYGSRIAGGSNPTYEFQFGGTTPVRSLVPIPLNVVPVLSLDGLIDVTIATPVNNNLLAYESATSLWKNKTAADLGVAPIASPTFTGVATTPDIIVSSVTASRLASFDASKNIKSLDTATYPNLTEIANVKGVNSPIQTQIDTRVKIIVKDVVPSAVVTGTVSETIMKSYLIAGGTFAASDIMNVVSFRCIKTGTATNVTQRIYINTTNSLSGATLIAVLAGASNAYRKMGRTFTLNGGNLIGLDLANTSLPSDVFSGYLGIISVPLNPANNFYIITTAQLDTSSANTIYQQEFYVTN